MFDFTITIPEYVECVSEDFDGLPYGILNPIVEIYFEPFQSMICDFDRIVFDAEGLWHWEHEEYYPEYAEAVMWELNYPENLNWFSNRPPKSFPGFVEDNHPVWGKAVNSLSWYKNYSSIQSLLVSDGCFLKSHIKAGYIRVNGDEKVGYGLKTYVNPETAKYTPTGGQPSLIKVSAPRSYVHWLTIGSTEENVDAYVFYPKRVYPGKSIRIILKLRDKVEFINWSHGRRGLYLEIFNFMDTKVIDKSERASTFFKEAINIAREAEWQYCASTKCI